MSIFWILYAAFMGALAGVNIGLFWGPLTDAIETRYGEWYRAHHAPSYVVSDATAHAMADAMQKACAATSVSAADAARILTAIGAPRSQGR